METSWRRSVCATAVLTLALAPGAPSSAAAAAPHRVAYSDARGDAASRVDILRVRAVTDRSTMRVRVQVRDLKKRRQDIGLVGNLYEDRFEIRLRSSRHGFTKKTFRWCYVGCSQWLPLTRTRVDWEARKDLVSIRIPARSVGLRSWVVTLEQIGSYHGEIGGVALGRGRGRDTADRYA